MIAPYCGAAPLPAEWLSRWNLDPVLIVALACGAALHLGLLIRERADDRNARLALAGSAWTLIALLLVSPLCALTSALFSARVAHHVVLIAAVAPLLVLSLPQRFARLRLPGVAGSGAFVLHMVLLWLWHAPAPYAAALADTRMFWMMELSLLGSALLLWLAVLAPAARLGSAMALLLGSVVQMGLLGAVITFARTPLYEVHLGATAPWGLSALQDQQLAGLVMWVPAAIPYLIAALMLLVGRFGAGLADEPAR
ncbi:cytochrome c oxidase assembly protein [Rhodopseudomonas palustris]|uniref:Cytochrome c oxidase assembly protein n=1 Tax=Rhodopseudomonas palustris TaxID=1076 RepID=A0A418VLH2_RHOPL|nr:cytochrome c oxidase assembly protein [Rhodopseudomonas palustris]RJF77016.1 cytochrome c oxidase assembly protein [Rhodopseudomonas palustris]